MGGHGIGEVRFPVGLMTSTLVSLMKVLAQPRVTWFPKMEKLDKPRPLRKGFRFNFPQPQRSGALVHDKGMGGGGT